MYFDNEEAYQEELDKLKSERPDCPYSDDGKHTWVEYGGDGVKGCIDCDYHENILIPR